jgi:pilus assembly protein CpaC
LRAKIGFAIAFCSALWLAMSAGRAVQAQAVPPQAAPSQPASSQAVPQAAPSPVPSAGVSFEDSTNDLSVGVGKAVLVDCAQPIHRVAVGVGDIAEAMAVSPTEVMINGKAPGETSLIIWDIRGGRQFFNIIVRASSGVTGDSLDAVRRELRTELPGQTVRVTYENNNVFLRGTVRDLTSSTRAVAIASSVGKVVNLLSVSVPAAEPQIMLKVRIASVDRNKALSLGINLFNLGLGNAVGGVSTGQFTPPALNAGSGSSSGGQSVQGNGATATFSNELNILAFFPGLNTGASIQALETKGVVQVLAEPNVMATNGKEASFLAGGEYPVPYVSGSSSGLAAVSINYKEYGVRLNFIPTITPRGTIRLQVAPEVSALDYTNEVEISGFQVPGLTTRKMNTEVELADGQTFVIGGLLDKSITDTFSKIPFIGDIPIIGKLFQSESKTKNDAELIVIVTPEIVQPIPAGGKIPELKYPDKFLPPNSNIPMEQPNDRAEGSTPAAAPTSVPVESLIESMKPERPLMIEGSSGSFGASGAVINSGNYSAPAPSTAPAPQQ